MPKQPASRRRFTAVMLLALIPIAIGLFYVTTMQRADRSEFYYSSNWSTVGTKHDVSCWGGDYRSVIRLWDSTTGKRKADWSVPRGSLAGFSLSPSGDQFFRFQKVDDKWEKIIVGTVANGPHSIDASFALKGGGTKHDIHWAEGEAKLIYEDTAGEFRCFDLNEGKHQLIRWDRPVNENGYFWIWDDNIVWYSKPEPTTERSYQLVGNELVLVGSVEFDESNEITRFFANGTRMIVTKVDAGRKTCEVVDVKSGETITTIQSDGRDVSHWDARNGAVTCYYGNGDYDADGAANIVGAQIFDAQSGELQYETDFSVRTTAIRYDADRKRYLVVNPNHQVESMDLSGRQSVVAPSQFRWWWPARVVFITLALVWWLSWSWTLRRDHRSAQPLIDIAILHAVVFFCSGARLWAYVYGPDWSGYLHVWESVVFLGTGLSIITMFLLWVMFGPQRWSVRVSFFVFGIAVVLGAIVLIWDANSGARGYSASLAIAQTMAGTLTQLIVQLGLLWLAHLVNVHLVHAHDPTAIQRLGEKRQTTIRDLLIWLVAFGVLFTIIRLRTVAIPNADNLVELVTSGSVAGVVGILTLWLGLGSKLWRVPVVLAGFALTWWYYHHIGRMELMHVGSGWLPMVLASAMVLRWNGYSLRRLSKSNAAGTSQSVAVAV